MALARLQESFFYFILVEGCTRPEFKEKEKKSREAFCPKSLLPTIPLVTLFQNMPQKATMPSAEEKRPESPRSRSAVEPAAKPR